MRILLDESLPKQLGPLLAGHDVRTVTHMGWAGSENGILLTKAAGRFDVLLTADQNIEYQQNIRRAGIGVVVLVAYDNRIESLSPLVPKVLDALNNLQPGELVRVVA